MDFLSSVKRVYFRFRGMQDKWNEWVEAESTRIAPHQAYTRAPHLLPKGKKADKKADTSKKDGEKKRSATPSSVASSTDADSAPPPPKKQATVDAGIVGGAASAPVVAAAFHPSLATVGVLLAVFGYVVGTYGAMLCTYLMEYHSNI